MCICGIASFNKSDLNLANKVNLMTKNLNHRGPDFNTTFKNSLGHFGFARLKIIDLSEKSNQPFQDINKKVSIIYNGEIYNYKSLKDKFFKILNLNLTVMVKYYYIYTINLGLILLVKSKECFQYVSLTKT